MTNCLHFLTTKSLFPRCYSSHRDPLLSGILLHDRHPGNSDKIDAKEMSTRIKLNILPLITAFSVPYLCKNFLVFFSQAKDWKKMGLLTLPIICISQKALKNLL